MPLETVADLGPGDIVLDGDRAPYKKVAQHSPRISAHAMSPNGCIDQEATWYGGRPRPWPHC